MLLRSRGQSLPGFVFWKHAPAHSPGRAGATRSPSLGQRWSVAGRRLPSVGQSWVSNCGSSWVAVGGSWAVGFRSSHEASNTLGNLRGAPAPVGARSRERLPEVGGGGAEQSQCSYLGGHLGRFDMYQASSVFSAVCRAAVPKALAEAPAANWGS